VGTPTKVPAPYYRPAPSVPAVEPPPVTPSPSLRIPESPPGGPLRPEATALDMRPTGYPAPSTRTEPSVSPSPTIREPAVDCPWNDRARLALPQPEADARLPTHPMPADRQRLRGSAQKQRAALANTARPRRVTRQRNSRHTRRPLSGSYLLRSPRSPSAKGCAPRCIHRAEQISVQGSGLPDSLRG
jgi:hypothetical protein